MKRALINIAALLVVACSGDSDEQDPRLWSHEKLMQGAEILAPGNTNNIRVVYLNGPAYQMGYQQGILLKQELIQFAGEMKTDLLFAAVVDMVENHGPDEQSDETYLDIARRHALPEVLDECDGIARATDKVFSRDICIFLNSIIWLLDDLLPRYFPDLRKSFSCSQFIGVDAATADGELLHARNMDWVALDAIMQNPVILVRSPDEGRQHVIFGFPGFFSAVTGANRAGIFVASNEQHCLEGHRGLVGVPALHQIGRVLQNAENLDQVGEIFNGFEQGSCQSFIASHGPSRQGRVFDMSRTIIAERTFDESGVVFATNNFVHPDMLGIQECPDADDVSVTTVARYARLSERLTGRGFAPHPDLDPGAPDYAYGRLDVEMAIDILRDPVDLRPDQGRKSYRCTEHLNGYSAIGNNRPVQSFVFKPEQMQAWMATGWDPECVNPLYNPYIGFDLESLFERTYDSNSLPSYDPPYNGSYGNGFHD